MSRLSNPSTTERHPYQCELFDHSDDLGVAPDYNEPISLGAIRLIARNDDPSPASTIVSHLDADREAVNPYVFDGLSDLLQVARDGRLIGYTLCGVMRDGTTMVSTAGKVMKWGVTHLGNLEYAAKKHYERVRMEEEDTVCDRFPPEDGA